VFNGADLLVWFAIFGCLAALVFIFWPDKISQVVPPKAPVPVQVLPSETCNIIPGTRQARPPILIPPRARIKRLDLCSSCEKVSECDLCEAADGTGHFRGWYCVECQAASQGALVLVAGRARKEARS
jgi:hypothetical protein